MRVCMASFSNLPLDARIQKEVFSLVRAGHEVVLIGFSKTITKKLVQKEQDFRQICYPFEQMLDNSLWERFKRGLRAVRLGFQIYWQTLLTSADVYHSHEAYPLPACFFAAKLRGKKLVYDAHELYQKNGWFSPVMLERLFIHRAEAVINVNDARAEVLRQRYGLVQQTVVMNCPSKKLPQKSCRLRRLLDISPNDFVVIYHGGFYPKERALDELIRAASLLPQYVHVVIMGFDSKGVQAILRKMITELRLSDRVHILDPIPPRELVEFATGADIGIIPQILVSDNQRFANPNKLFEYMASQLAIVATDTPTISPIVQRFGLGEVFVNARAEEMSRAIMRLLEVPGYLHVCKMASRRAAEEVFFWEKEEKGLLELYTCLEIPVEQWAQARMNKEQ
jgi:glycosyltransferase involved in cell wall biosynthesis